MCPALPVGGAPLVRLVTFFLPILPVSVPYGLGGSIFPAVRRPPSHTVSASSASRRGGLSPPSAWSCLPSTRRAPGPGEGAGPSGHPSHPEVRGRGAVGRVGRVARRGAGPRRGGRASRNLSPWVGVVFSWGVAGVAEFRLFLDGFPLLQS